MQPNMKTVWFAISIIASLLFAACGSQSGSAKTDVIPTDQPAQQMLKTSVGEFVIVSARLVDEVHDSQAPSGQKFLLIGLVDANMQKLVPGEFLLEKLQAAIQESQNEIYISAKDGSQTFYTQMGGWIEDDFVIGFTVPEEETYTLYWPDNAPIPLNVVK